MEEWVNFCKSGCLLLMVFLLSGISIPVYGKNASPDKVRIGAKKEAKGPQQIEDLDQKPPKERVDDHPLKRFYNFFVRTIKHKNIHKRLNTLQGAQDIGTRDEFGFIFPEEKFGEDADKEEIKENLNDEVAFAAAEELIDSIKVLKSLKNSLSFEIDFLAPFKETKKPKKPTVKYGIAESQGGDKKSAKQGKGKKPKIVPIAEKKPEHRQNSAKKKNRNIGKFNGSLQPNLAKDDFTSNKSLDQGSGFDFVFQQNDGFYIFRTPLRTKTSSEGITHEFNIPVIGNVSAGRQFNYKGDPIRSSINNVLSNESGLRLDLHYLHQDENFSTELIYNEEPHRFNFKSKLPRQKKPNKDSFTQEGVEYSVGYSMPL